MSEHQPERGNCSHNICAEYGKDKLYYGCLFNDLWSNEEPRD